MRLLLDAHLSGPRIANPLRAKGHDVRAVSEEAGTEGLDDDEVLILATAERRILVTQDVSDFPGLLRDWAGAKRPHGGVVLIYGMRSDEFRAIVSGLDRLLDELHRQADWADLTLVLKRTA